MLYVLIILWAAGADAFPTYYGTYETKKDCENAAAIITHKVIDEFYQNGMGTRAYRQLCIGLPTGEK